MKIGVLTGGDDCAGLNAALRGVVKRAEDHGFGVVGIRRGWKGLVEPSATKLTFAEVADVVAEGGSIILTSRADPFETKAGPQKVIRSLKKLGLDCLVVIGSKETLEAANRLAKLGLKAVGIPATMENHLTVGFDSAVRVAMEGIDRIKTTGMSHERVMVVEVMGGGAGWVAANAGIASGAHVVLVPGEPFDIEKVCKTLTRRAERGRTSSLVVVAEGAKPKGMAEGSMSVAAVDAFGNPIRHGVGRLLAQEIERRTGLETREVVLGHVVRGGTPSAYDRVIATRLGTAAVDLVKARKFGVMVTLKEGNEIVPVRIGATGEEEPDRDELYALANSFSGSR